MPRVGQHGNATENNDQYFNNFYPGQRKEDRTVSLSLHRHLLIPELLPTIQWMESQSTALAKDLSEVMNAALVCADSPEQLQQIDENWIRRAITPICTSGWNSRSPLKIMKDVPEPTADGSNMMHIHFLTSLNVLIQSRNLAFMRHDDAPFGIPEEYHWPVVQCVVGNYIALQYRTALVNRATVPLLQMLKRELVWRMRRHFGEAVTTAQANSMWKYFVRFLRLDGLPVARAGRLPIQHVQFVRDVLVPLVLPLLPEDLAFPLEQTPEAMANLWHCYLYILLNLQRERESWIDEHIDQDTHRPPKSFNVGPIFSWVPHPYTIDSDGLAYLYRLHNDMNRAAPLLPLPFHQTFAVGNFENKTRNVAAGPTLMTDGTVAHQRLQKVFTRRFEPFSGRPGRDRPVVHFDRGDVVLGADPNVPELTVRGVDVIPRQETIPAWRPVPYSDALCTDQYNQKTLVFSNRDRLERYTITHGLDAVNSELGTSKTANQELASHRLARVARYGPSLLDQYRQGPSKENNLASLRNRDKFLHKWGREIQHVGRDIGDALVRYSKSTRKFFGLEPEQMPPAPVILAVGQIAVVHQAGLPGLTTPLKRLITLLLLYRYIKRAEPVHEYLTSQICSTCIRNGVLNPPKMENVHRGGRLIWRLKYCARCDKVRNRDANAAINILLVFLYQNATRGLRLPQLAIGRQFD